jgi:hypothetical protein
LAISLFLATEGEISGQSGFGKSVDAKALKLSYISQPVDSIRKVDFKNLWYWFVHGTGGASFRLRDGKFEDKSDFGGNEISLVRVYYFQLKDAEPEWALVQIAWSSGGGSSSDEGVLQVFKVEEEQLVMTQQFEYDLQAKGTGMDFNPKTGILIVRARTRDNTAHCCPKHIDIVTYRWNGKTFEEKTHQTIPTEGR